MPNETFATPKEAAEILRVTKRTIYNLIRAGSLPARRVGGSWRIPRSFLEEEEKIQSRPAQDEAASAERRRSVVEVAALHNFALVPEHIQKKNFDHETG